MSRKLFLPGCPISRGRLPPRWSGTALSDPQVEANLEDGNGDPTLLNTTSIRESVNQHEGLDDADCWGAQCGMAPSLQNIVHKQNGLGTEMSCNDNCENVIQNVEDKDVGPDYVKDQTLSKTTLVDKGNGPLREMDPGNVSNNTSVDKENGLLREMDPGNVFNNTSVDKGNGLLREMDPGNVFNSTPVDIRNGPYREMDVGSVSNTPLIDKGDGLHTETGAGNVSNPTSTDGPALQEKHLVRQMCMDEETDLSSVSSDVFTTAPSSLHIVSEEGQKASVSEEGQKWSVSEEGQKGSVSKEGQKARQRFSSGYATGSGSAGSERGQTLSVSQDKVFLSQTQEEDTTKTALPDNIHGDQFINGENLSTHDTEAPVLGNNFNSRNTEYKLVMPNNALKIHCGGLQSNDSKSDCVSSGSSFALSINDSVLASNDIIYDPKHLQLNLNLGEGAKLNDRSSEESHCEGAKLNDRSREESHCEGDKLNDRSKEESHCEGAKLLDRSREENLGEEAKVLDRSREENLGEGAKLLDRSREENLGEGAKLCNRSIEGEPKLETVIHECVEHVDFPTAAGRTTCEASASTGIVKSKAAVVKPCASNKRLARGLGKSVPGVNHQRTSTVTHECAAQGRTDHTEAKTDPNIQLVDGSEGRVEHLKSRGPQSVNEALRDFDSLSSDFSVPKRLRDHSFGRKLEYIGRCKDWQCGDTTCQQMKEEIMVLRDPRVQIEHLTDSQRDVLHCMYEHSCFCYQLRCPYFWCDETLQEQASDELGIEKMKRHVEGFVESFFYCTDSDWSDADFKKLDQSLPFDTLAHMNRECFILCPMSRSHRTVLAAHTKCGWKFNYWVITKIPVSDEPNREMSLYAKLAELRDPNVVHYLWVAYLARSEQLLVCHQCEACSLQDFLKQRPMTLTLALPIMLQLVDVTRRLHSAGIIYLDWRASNILCDPRPLHDGSMSVKLSNFSASVLVESEDNQVDTDHVCNMLPLHLSPPELLRPCQVNRASDVWGLGCLLCELASGKPIWHEQRHLSTEELHKQMACHTVPPLPNTHCVVTHLLDLCLKNNPSERPTLGVLEKELRAALKHFCD